MKTIKKVEVTTKFITTVPDFLEQNVIYISERHHTAIHLCLCGCGNKSVTPFRRNFGSKEFGWSIAIAKGYGVTIMPSILNTNCPNRTHYIITNGIANILE